MALTAVITTFIALANYMKMSKLQREKIELEIENLKLKNKNLIKEDTYIDTDILEKNIGASNQTPKKLIQNAEPYIDTEDEYGKLILESIAILGDNENNILFE